MAHSIPLPGPSRPQVSMGPLDDGSHASGVAGDRGAVRDHDDLRRVDVEAATTRRWRPASVITTTASAAPATASRTSRWCGVGERRTVWATTIVGASIASNDVDDRVAVLAGVEAVLVLDDHDIGPRQRCPSPPARASSSCPRASPRRVHHRRVCRRRRPGRRSTSSPPRDEPVAQRGREGGDAAGRRRERRDDRVGPTAGARARTVHRPVGVVQVHSVSSRQLGQDVEPAQGDGVSAVQPKPSDSPRVKPQCTGQPDRAEGTLRAVDRSVAPSCRALRIAVLAPIAWRVPPVHYGPWEQFASLLTEGLVARGHDVTLFAAGNSETAATLASVVPHGWSEATGHRREGRRVHPHRRRLRAGRRVRRHPQRVRLPPADLQPARRHARRDHDPRLLVAADRPRLRALRRSLRLRRHQRRRPPSRAAATRRRSTTASTPTRSRCTRHPATTCCSSAASTPTRGRPPPSRSHGARGGRS